VARINDNCAMTLAEESGTATVTKHPPSDTKTDGRFYRSLQTREKIVAALIALIGSGNPSPTAEQIAAHAQVGLRSVFRHFDDMETLEREITSKLDAVMMPLVLKPLTAVGWQARLMESVDRRCEIFDLIAPYHIASQMRVHASEHMRRQVARSAALQRESLRRILPAALVNDQALFEAIALLLSLDAWVRLRSLQGLSAPEATATIQRAIQKLVS